MNILKNVKKTQKSVRHDVRNHLELLTKLINSKQYEEVNDYLEKINIKIDELGNAVSIGNGIAEAIVNKYYYQAIDSGVKMKVSGVLPAECKD